MSIADHFDHRADAGFRSFDQALQARRQFRVSLGLVVALALALAVVVLASWSGHAAGPSAADASFAGALAPAN